MTELERLDDCSTAVDNVTDATAEFATQVEMMFDDDTPERVNEILGRIDNLMNEAFALVEKEIQFKGGASG